METTSVLSRDEEIMSGALVFFGTRIPISMVLRSLGGGRSFASISSELYPSLAIQQIKTGLLELADALEFEIRSK